MGRGVTVYSGKKATVSVEKPRKQIFYIQWKELNRLNTEIEKN